MNKESPLTLVLGETGKTASRVTAALAKRDLPVPTAARAGVNVTFDWSHRHSYAHALDGIGRVYLVAPVDAEDIASVAATTLADPQAHAGEAYRLTGPAAFTIAEAAAIISDEAGSTFKHVDLDREAWITIAGTPPRTFRNFAHKNANAWEPSK